MFWWQMEIDKNIQASHKISWMPFLVESHSNPRIRLWKPGDCYLYSICVWNVIKSAIHPPGCLMLSFKWVDNGKNFVPKHVIMFPTTVPTNWRCVLERGKLYSHCITTRAFLPHYITITTDESWMSTFGANCQNYRLLIRDVTIFEAHVVARFIILHVEPIQTPWLETFMVISSDPDRKSNIMNYCPDISYLPPRLCTVNMRARLRCRDTNCLFSFVVLPRISTFSLSVYVRVPPPACSSLPPGSMPSSMPYSQCLLLPAERATTGGGTNYHPIIPGGDIGP